MAKDFQFVWPKDGPKGRSGHRGFFGRLNNILTNRGPDVYLQRKGSSSPIKPEMWGNWNSYHDPVSHWQEQSGPYTSRGIQRYDPHSRRYKTWATLTDFNSFGTDGRGPGTYPRFTANEWRQMALKLSRGQRVDPERMGSEWNHDGPKRFTQEHDWFWQNAHQIGENRRQGLPFYFGPNPNLRMHQEWPEDLQDWMLAENLPHT